MASAYKFNKSCLAWTEATGNAWWLWGLSTHLEHPLDIHGFHFIGYVIWFSWQTLLLHLLSSVTIPQLHLKRQPKKKNLFPSPWPKVALALVSLSVLALVLVFVLEKELLLVLAFISDSSSHRHTCTSLFPPEREKKSISTLEIASRSVIPCHLPATCLAQCLLFGRRKKPDKVGIRLYLSCSQFIVPCTQTTLMKGCGAVINIKLWEIFFLG